MKTISIEKYKQLLHESMNLQKALQTISKLKNVLNEKRFIIKEMQKKVHYYEKYVDKSSVSILHSHIRKCIFDPHVHIFAISNLFL